MRGTNIQKGVRRGSGGGQEGGQEGVRRGSCSPHAAPTSLTAPTTATFAAAYPQHHQQYTRWRNTFSPAALFRAATMDCTAYGDTAPMRRGDPKKGGRGNNSPPCLRLSPKPQQLHQPTILDRAFRTRDIGKEDQSQSGVKI
eukprot:1190553-Prorocentrum_minimum.AAC.1